MIFAITGASGILGSTIKKTLDKQDFENIILDRHELEKIADPNLLAIYFINKKISCLVHCAANTNVDLCELNPKECFRDNVDLTELIATACDKAGVKLIFISSTGVYGEYKDTPYDEDDPVCPTTVHHQSKWLAEKVVQQVCENFLIIRTGWLFGGLWHGKKNFVAKRIMEAKKSNGSILSDISQFGCPTSTTDLARCIVLLIINDISGTFNCVNEGFASRYEYVSTIIEFSGLDVEVNVDKESGFKRTAKVSKNEMAINRRLERLSIFEMPNWRDSLEEYISRQMTKTK